MFVRSIRLKFRIHEIQEIQQLCETHLPKYGNPARLCEIHCPEVEIRQTAYMCGLGPKTVWRMKK